MRHSAVPTTNVAVREVSQPMANRKWALRCSAYHFYRKIGWGTHAWHPHRCRCPVARWMQMATLEAAICISFNRVPGSVMLVSKPCRAWRPSPSNRVRQRRALPNRHTYLHMHLISFRYLRLSRLSGVKFFINLVKMSTNTSILKL